jgi:hypothetical protein
MGRWLAAVVWCSLAAVALPVKQHVRAGEGEVPFDERFTNETLRVDVVHFGSSSEEGIVLRRAVREPHWSGPRAACAASRRAGAYILRLRDKATGAEIFEWGFSTLFGEWRTTEDATEGRKAFEETYEMPCPKGPVDLAVSAWAEAEGNRPIAVISIDPRSLPVRAGAPNAGREAHELVLNGEPHRRVDLALLGDGYTAGEREKFLGDCAHVIADFFDVEPFRSMRGSFNVRAVYVPSVESGIDEPSKGIYRDTAFGLSFDTFGSERYCMTEEVWAVHDALTGLPHDAVLIMGNSSRYGGGAIYNLYTAFTSDNEYGDYLCVHEFGHGFAGLADEYYSSEVSYNEFYPRGREPWEPNITALLDAGALKWGDLVEEGTPIPTPADATRFGGVVGVFEGAGYAAKGLYRPSLDCKMFSKGNREFCRVCDRAIRETILYYSSE